MDMVTALAIAVAVLIAVWVKFVSATGMYWFIAAIGMACFLAAGGKFIGLRKVVAAGVAGMTFAAFAELALLTTGHLDLEWVALGVAAFLIVIASKWSFLSFIPAGLCGATVTAAGGPMGVMDLPANLKLGFAFVFGAAIGWVAERAAGMMAKKA